MRRVSRRAVAGLALAVSCCGGPRAPAVGPPGPEARPAEAPRWRERGDRWEVELPELTASLQPSTLGLDVIRAGRRLTVSAPASASEASDLEASGGRLSWTLPERGLRVAVRADGGRLHLRFASTREQELEWPGGITGSDEAALVVPVSEGLYLPVTDRTWVEVFDEGGEECFTTHGGLSLPALGLAEGEDEVTLLWPRELRNEVCLRSRQGRLEARAVHDFRARDGLPDYEVVVAASAATPIAPALELRRWLVEHGQHETLRDKAARVPETERLFGATHAYLYGDGRTRGAVDRLRALGLDRMWLGYDQDERSDPRLVDAALVRHAASLGYLVGPYDTHNDVQDPAAADSATAVYTRELFERGGVMRADGSRTPGFGGRGLLLSSEALRRTGLFEQRVDRAVATGIDSYFLDCDAFGDLVDDYDPDHPMTEAVDQRNKLARLSFLSRTKGLVTGSESAAAWAVPALHFSHGPHTVQSRLFWRFLSDVEAFGGYRPAARPDVFFRQVDAPDRLRRTIFDVRYRVPLYQAAFHDALVSTDRWELSPVKLADLVQLRTLLMVLYGVPPVWSLDVAAIEEQGPRMARHHRFFSPLHRAIAPEPLESFEWLTPDRLVQRARFGDVVELTASFRAEPFEGLPPLCVRALWLRDGRVEDYCPAP